MLVLDDIPSAFIPLDKLPVPAVEYDVNRLCGKTEDDAIHVDNDGPVVREWSNSARIRLSYFNMKF